MLEIFAALAEFGLTGARVPATSGGAGLTMLDYGLIFERLPAVVCLALIAHEGTVSRLYAGGVHQRFPEIFEALLDGTKIACTASTEPSTGSDPRSIQLRIVDAVDGGTAGGARASDTQTVALTGTKQWITNGTLADYALVTGKTASGELRRYLVARAESPFGATEIPCIGLRQGHLSELNFNALEVPRANLLDETNSTMHVLTEAWFVNRPLFGLLGLALARASATSALEYVKGRSQFGAPLARKQLIQESLVDMESSIAAARLYCLMALASADQGRSTPALSAMAKRQALVVAEKSASKAMRICGAMGLADETGLEQNVRDIKMLTIPDGTYEVLTLIAGRELTGERAL